MFILGHIIINQYFTHEVDIIINHLEILDPYPNEILYSWLSRMFYWYGFQNQPRSNICSFNKMLFSTNSRSINNIIIPHNLHELVQNIGLNESKYFSTDEYLIKRMTLIPFYLFFINISEKEIVVKSLIHNGPINITKSLLGLKDLNCKSGNFKLKFCYQCWAENQYMYFDVEHQVKNNNICYKHNTRLQYILSNSSNYFLFDNLCIDKYIDSPYCISQNDEFLPCYIQISSMINDIFINGFKDDLIRLKSKIRMKMLSLGYMREDFNFIRRFDDFWLFYNKYNLLNIDKKEFINVIYSTESSNPNPITYLTLIISLFGSLKSYYDYKIDEKYIKIIHQKSSKIISLTQPLKPCGLIYYNDLIYDLYKDRYIVIRKEDKKYYAIRCNSCNHEWKIPQYYIRRELVKCPNCKKENKEIKINAAYETMHSLSDNE